MRRGITGVLIVLLAALSGALLLVGTAAVRYEQAARAKPRVVEYTKNQNSFLAASSSDASDRDVFVNHKKALIAEAADFIEADLEAMKITLYENGVAKETVPIASKGRDGSWWETPTGRYAVLGKETEHFSSIGQVWMPWSIQFYGNFFIHGWPHYDDGTPVPPSYSGGCIRLSNENAEKVFRFAAKGMPIIILDADSKPAIKPALEPLGSAITPPRLSPTSTPARFCSTRTPATRCRSPRSRNS